MRIPNLGETELLVPLHDGVFEQPMWGTFLDRLRRAAATEHAGILLRTGLGEDFVELAAEGDRWPEMLEHVIHQVTVGEQAAYRTMREGRVYSQSELGEYAQADLRVRAMRLSEADRFDAVIFVADAVPIGSEIGLLLTALASHLRVALRVLASLEQERARSSMNADAFARMNFGWISLDARCRIVDCDAQAARHLERSTVLRRGHYDRLTPAAPAADRQLTALVRSFADDPKARARAIKLSHDPWVDILVAPLRLPALGGETKAVAAVYLRGDRSSSADRREQLCDLFDLTPSEARLAWSLAQGQSIAEAAEEHGLTVETARYYSKKIYGKTGARGQVDLVRNILTGVLALA